MAQARDCIVEMWVGSSGHVNGYDGKTALVVAVTWTPWFWGLKHRAFPIAIIESDAVLRVWRDANGDGKTNTGELLTLAQARVREISLAKTASGADSAGNRVDFTGTFTRTNGTTGASAAISFAVNQTLTKWKPPACCKVSAEAEKPPTLTGYGRLKDLAAAGPLTAVRNLSPAA